MSPCSPNDVSVNIPDGPSGPSIGGFGIPFSLKIPDLNPFPDGFPEDLLGLLDSLQLLIPPGPLMPQLNLNFGKDVFDAIMKLLDQFMPFLMLYKFFLPILNMIICIIEVLCALMNPFKLIRALKRLFTQCIPAFLNLFPIFALIIMIISLLLLILALILYIIEQIIKFVKLILRNILALKKAFSDGDANGVLAIAKKLGATLCIFQNLFVLFAIFNIIINIIKDILSLAFSIPPCDDGDPNNQDGCCTPDVCPAIVKNQFTNDTGTFKYLNQVGFSPTLSSPLPPSFAALFNFDVRGESWQIYDTQQILTHQFRDIFDAADVTISPKPIFFPTDGVYNAKTDPTQAPYKINLRLFYNPASWGRSGTPRFIRFTNCIVTTVPTVNLLEGNLVSQTITSGVALIAGGLGTEDDNTTILTGFKADGTTSITDQATLENFIHKPEVITDNPASLSINDGYTFSNMTYTFVPNIAPLLTKNLVTLGCVPDLALDRAFINNIFAGDAAIKTAQLQQAMSKTGNPGFPNPGAAQQCLATAVTALQANLTVEGVAIFQATCNICLKKLQDDTNNAIGEVIGIGIDPCKSSFAAEPPVQFTSKPIKVTVKINERNGLLLTAGISPEVATNLAARIKSHVDFGTVDNFVYDGYGSFNANIRSSVPGNGVLSISFDNNVFCTNTIPADVSLVPTHDLQSLNYQFVYTPVGSLIPLAPTADGDISDGTEPRRDEGDLSTDGDGGKNGV